MKRTTGILSLCLLATVALAMPPALGVETNGQHAQSSAISTAASPEAIADRPDPKLPSFAGHVSQVIPSDEWDKQELPVKVGLVADHIRELADPVRFAGLRVNESDGLVEVWWAGGVPDVVAEYAASQPLGIRVALFGDARFSRAIAEQAVETLLADRDGVKELGVAYTSIRYDGSGVDVAVLGAPPSAARAAELGRLVGLPDGLFFIGESSPIVETTGTRQSDTSPYTGGARLRSPVNSTTDELYSSGFAMLDGAYGLLATVNHSNPSGSRVVRNGAGSQIAPASGVSTYGAIDLNLVDPTASPATEPRIYTGSWSSSTRALVKNWAANNVGQSVCQSGGTSGTRCSTIINDGTQYITSSKTYTGNWYILTEASSGWAQAGGDSGAPVYRTVTGGVQARGIAQAASIPVPCGSTNPDAGPDVPCYLRLLYLPISVAQNYTGANLEVG